VLAATAALVIGTGPVWARDPAESSSTTVDLDSSGLPVMAAGLAQPTEIGPCGIAAGAPAGRDIWIFTVQGAGVGLVSLSATFRAPAVSASPAISASGTPTPTAPTSPTADGAGSTSVSADPAESTKVTAAQGVSSADGAVLAQSAWVASPAGWLLTTASAQVTGGEAVLQLTAACPAAAAVSATTLPPTPKPTLSRRAAGATLPISGPDVLPIVQVGAGLVLTGVLLLVVRPRRARRAPDPDLDDDIRRPMINRRF
jgi:hypothetical protein